MFNINHKYYGDITIASGSGSVSFSFVPEHETLTYLMIGVKTAVHGSNPTPSTVTFDWNVIDEDTEDVLFGGSVGIDDGGAWSEKYNHALTGNYSLNVYNASQDVTFRYYLSNFFNS
jgi:hypothetical protein